MSGFFSCLFGDKVSRYCFYINGFYVYYALNGDPSIDSFPYRKYNWLNYRKLAESVIGQKDTIIGIPYFTSSVTTIYINIAIFCIIFLFKIFNLTFISKYVL